MCCAHHLECASGPFFFLYLPWSKPVTCSVPRFPCQLGRILAATSQVAVGITGVRVYQDGWHTCAPGNLFKAEGIEEGLCGSSASNITSPLSTLILASLYESPQGDVTVIFSQTANTPGDNSQLRNRDSTLTELLRGPEIANSLPPAPVSSPMQ